IYLGGTFDDGEGKGFDITRLADDGTLDSDSEGHTGFGGDGIYTDPNGATLRGLTTDGSGGVVAVGYVPGESTLGMITDYNSDASSRTITTADSVVFNAVTRDGTGRFLVGGENNGDFV